MPKRNENNTESLPTPLKQTETILASTEDEWNQYGVIAFSTITERNHTGECQREMETVTETISVSAEEEWKQHGVTAGEGQRGMDSDGERSLLFLCNSQKPYRRMRKRNEHRMDSLSTL